MKKLLLALILSMGLLFSSAVYAETMVVPSCNDMIIELPDGVKPFFSPIPLQERAVQSPVNNGLILMSIYDGGIDEYGMNIAYLLMLYGNSTDGCSQVLAIGKSSILIEDGIAKEDTLKTTYWIYNGNEPVVADGESIKKLIDLKLTTETLECE